IIIVFSVEFAVAAYLIRGDFQSSKSIDLETVRIESQKTPLSAGIANKNGKILSKEDSIVSDKSIEINLSNIDSGYIQIRYNGSHNHMVIEVRCVDRNGNVHELSSKKGMISPYFEYPVGAGWQGYALPYGSGTYTINCIPYDKYNNKEISKCKKNEIATFAFKAVYDELTTYQYRNVYSNYDEDSATVGIAAYLLSRAERTKGQKLTDKEKTEVIIPFIRENIKEDDIQVKQSKMEKDKHYKFPDVDKAINTGVGNCNERSAVAAIMLKSQSIPVKIIHGYILRKDANGKAPTRIYHAWLNVYRDGRWAMYDPTAFDNEVTNPAENDFCEYLLDTALIR
ncbi:MAG: transglutaminase domain-containing protein, partial [Clostridiales Family XIII bacterium]|nr:transglutaminase domain-containing protein [Clostridiales Family XIII bacterium]